MSLVTTNTNWSEKRLSNVPEEFGAQKHPFAHVSQSKSIMGLSINHRGGRVPKIVIDYFGVNFKGNQ